MLTYFPTPYPDEWWYSTLCRYHVRTGNQNPLITLHELYGTPRLSHAKLVPGVDCYAISKKIPQYILSLEEILLKHTLIPYYIRFFPIEKKQKILNRLTTGVSAGITGFQAQTPEGKQGLKFCPLCYAEDIDTYGEPYWHREHQIPLLPLCPKHGCRLHLVEIPFSELEKVFLPLYEVSNTKDVIQSNTCLPWEPLLSSALFSIVTMPFHIGPPQGYSNLEHVLRSEKFSNSFIKKGNIFDTEKLRRYCFEFYGEAIGKQYFSGISHAVLIRTFRWELSLPEHYVLLAIFAGMTIEDLFGPEVQTTDPLLKKILKYKDMDIRKDQLAELIGVDQRQLDILANKYGIKPFWNRRNGVRMESLRINLSAEEKRSVTAAANKYGNKKMATFARKIILQEVERILVEYRESLDSV